MSNKNVKKPKVERREPSQERAERTRLLIFEAAIRVLESDGLAGFNTNRIAEVAGYSVGTLYQYFADKHALLDALIAHEQACVLTEVRQLLARKHDDTQAIGARVHALLQVVAKVLGGRRHARRLLIERALRLHGQGELNQPVVALVERLVMEKELFVIQPPLQPAEAFVLIQSVAGAIRAAMIHNERLLREPAFKTALVRVIQGFLAARGTSG